MTSSNPINHLAIIMDGNARWAKSKGLPKIEGHRNGAESIKTLIPGVIKHQIKYLTLFAFSAENWNRPETEVNDLLDLLSYYIKKETSTLSKQGIRIKIIGRLDSLSASLRKTISEAVELTKDNQALTLCIAFGYGGRQEIIDACQKIIDQGYKEVNEDIFKSFLYDQELPNVDLLIRTSGEKRISNFLLWQIAYAELYFCSKYWPDFKEEDLHLAIADYQQRQRNFGHARK